jgi:hypothetical protein
MNAFISHSSLDKPIARRVAESFRRRGLQVWVDEGELGPGDSLGERLATTIGASDIFVIILTKNSVSSKWVEFELSRAVSDGVLNGKRIVPLRFDDCPVPSSLQGQVWADVSTQESITHAVNLTLKRMGSDYPISARSLAKRYEDGVPVEFGLRLVPKEVFRDAGRLGAEERRYVFLADYDELSGRSLTEALGALRFGDSLDATTSSCLEWIAIVFELGWRNKKKFDLLPATWKAIFRIVSDPGRLGIISPSAEQTEFMGTRPRNYYEDDQDYWRRQSDDLSIDLPTLFGLQDNCFFGDGRSVGEIHGDVKPRMFLMKNVPLSALSYWLQDLGFERDGIVIA